MVLADELLLEWLFLLYQLGWIMLILQKKVSYPIYSLNEMLPAFKQPARKHLLLPIILKWTQ